LVRTALDDDGEGEEGRAARNRMTDLDRRLCLGFLHYHHLRGVDSPLPLFRITDYSAHPGNDGFMRLLGQLTGGAQHAAEVADFLKRYAPRSQTSAGRWKEVIDPLWVGALDPSGSADPCAKPGGAGATGPASGISGL